MATATLNFDLNEHEDVVAHLRCVKATKLAVCLWDMDQYLRAQTKYAPDSMTQEAYDALIKAREELGDIMRQNSVDLDELLN